GSRICGLFAKPSALFGGPLLRSHFAEPCALVSGDQLLLSLALALLLDRALSSQFCECLLLLCSHRSPSLSLGRAGAQEPDCILDRPKHQAPRLKIAARTAVRPKMPLHA